MIVACRKTHVFDTEKDPITMANGCPICGGRLVQVDKLVVPDVSDLSGGAEITKILSDGNYDSELYLVVRRKVKINK